MWKVQSTCPDKHFGTIFCSFHQFWKFLGLWANFFSGVCKIAIYVSRRIFWGGSLKKFLEWNFYPDLQRKLFGFQLVSNFSARLWNLYSTCPRVLFKRNFTNKIRKRFALWTRDFQALSRVFFGRFVQIPFYALRRTFWSKKLRFKKNCKVFGVWGKKFRNWRQKFSEVLWKRPSTCRRAIF